LFRLDYGHALRDDPPGIPGGDFYFGIGHAF
jgi:hypothetical protein